MIKASFIFTVKHCPGISCGKIKLREKYLHSILKSINQQGKKKYFEKDFFQASCTDGFSFRKLR